MAQSWPPQPGETGTWTVRDVLQSTGIHLARQQVSCADVVAEILCAHALSRDRLDLARDPGRAIVDTDMTLLRPMVERAADGEPVQYIVGTTSFFGLRLEVNRSTQIPQPCTEDLVRLAISECAPGESGASIRIVDLGTGTGCIAIALACNVPRARVVATDIVDDALALAARNARRHGVDDRIEFRSGSLLQPLADDEPADLLCGNLPYIPDHEFDAGLVEPSVQQYVPRTALSGGSDGLGLVGPVIMGSAACLHSGGLLLLEIAASSSREALDLVAGIPGLTDGRVERDAEGYQRFLLARKAP